MATNVDDYGNRVAKAIAADTGQIIRGIFWVRDSTVVKLENGTLNRIQKSTSTDKPMNLRPSTLRNLERVKGMTKATENFGKSVLSGVVSREPPAGYSRFLGYWRRCYPWASKLMLQRSAFPVGEWTIQSQLAVDDREYSCSR